MNIGTAFRSDHPDELKEPDAFWFSSTTKVDPEVWERVKLSEFYTAQEAAEAQ